jgi:Na+/H+-dicarboxylate symporter
LREERFLQVLFFSVLFAFLSEAGSLINMIGNGVATIVVARGKERLKWTN